MPFCGILPHGYKKGHSDCFDLLYHQSLPSFPQRG